MDMNVPNQKIMTTIERAFAIITPNENERRAAYERLRDQMQKPAPRAYHNETHVAAVLDCLFTWSDGLPPSVPLLAAALYHDAIYDPASRDNESLSATFCRDELVRLGVGEANISEAARLIELTAGHIAQKNGGDTDDFLLLDADLFTLGDTPENYAAYVRAIRTEYAHVPDTAWRKGRAGVMRTFAARERLYGGLWEGREEREKQARANIAGEIASLS